MVSNRHSPRFLLGTSRAVFNEEMWKSPRRFPQKNGVFHRISILFHTISTGKLGKPKKQLDRKRELRLNRKMKSEKQEETSKTTSRRRCPLAPFVLIPKVFFTRYSPSWKAVLTYTALVYYSNNVAGSCEGVTIKTMASRVGIGKRTFLRAVEELEKKGIVKVTHRSRESESGNRIPLANLYELADLQPDGGEPI